MSKRNSIIINLILAIFFTGIAFIYKETCCMQSLYWFPKVMMNKALDWPEIEYIFPNILFNFIFYSVLISFVQLSVYYYKKYRIYTSKG